jgi:hypothetical protein
MGYCHEFGVVIEPACDHEMVAGRDACSCPECGVVCTGKFGGCPTVWARGPVAVGVGRRTRRDREVGADRHSDPGASPPAMTNLLVPLSESMPTDDDGAEPTEDRLAAIAQELDVRHRMIAEAMASLSNDVARAEAAMAEQLQIERRSFAEVRSNAAETARLLRVAVDEAHARLADAQRATEDARVTFERSQDVFDAQREGMAEAVAALNSTRHGLEQRVAHLDETLPRSRAAAETALAAAETANEAEARLLEQCDRIGEIIDLTDRLEQRQRRLVDELDRLLSRAEDLQRLTQNRLGRIPTDIDATSFTEFRRASRRIGRIEPLAWLALAVSAGASAIAIIAVATGAH